jgi:superfamily II DNA or RNA helicase
MIKIRITNTRCFIEGEFSTDWNKNKEFQASIRGALSYEVPGADFSPKFKEGKWDGRISLWDWRTRSFPTGCISQIVDLFKELDVHYEVADERRKPKPNTNLDTTFAEQGKKLHFYQEAAVEKAEKIGRGILSMATGSGKTFVACELLSRFKTYPFLFFVPSISLLRQTHREFTKYLKQDGHPPHIGFIGANVCDINFKGINVITYQTALSAFNEVYKEKTNAVEIDNLAGEIVRKTLDQLKSENTQAKKKYNQALKAAQIKYESIKEQDETKYNKKVVYEIRAAKTVLSKTEMALERRHRSLENKKDIRKLVDRANGFIVDEAHVAAVIVETLGSHAENAYWRIGLSATPFREDNQEIRIQGTMGRKLIEISASDLIELGYLVPPHIFMVKIDHYETTEDYREAYRKHIVHGWERNYRIKQFAEAFKEAGKPVLILVEQIEHGQILEQMIRDSVFVAGSDKGEDDPDAAERDYRRRMLNETEANNIILIATQWAYVGIDCPPISTLILAGSCQSAVSTYQCIGRVLRTSPRKTEAVIIDFMDKDENLHQHSLYRKRIYQREPNWQFKLVKPI